MASVSISEFQTVTADHAAFDSVSHLCHRALAPAIRRRPTPTQGRSLEILGHAIEYLVDSDLHVVNGSACAQPSEAARILMRLSREVFGECREVVPIWQRVRQRLHLLAERKHAHVGAAAAVDLIR